MVTAITVDDVSTIELQIPDPNDPNAMVDVDYFSYVSVDDANKVLRSDPVRWPAWASSAITDEMRQEALVAATEVIDRHRFKGTQVDVTQPLKFPRDGVVVDFTALPATPLPRNLVAATAKLAATILTNPEAYGIPNKEDRSVQREQVGPLSTTYFHPESLRQNTESLAHIDNEVYKLIQPLLAAYSPRVIYNQSDYTCPNTQWYDDDWSAEYTNQGGSGPQWSRR